MPLNVYFTMPKFQRATYMQPTTATQSSMNQNHAWSVADLTTKRAMTTAIMAPIRPAGRMRCCPPLWFMPVMLSRHEARRQVVRL